MAPPKDSPAGGRIGSRADNPVIACQAPFHICRQIVCIETYQWAITLTNQCSGHIAGGAARRSIKILDIPLSARSAPISPVRSAGTRRPTCGPESAARVFRPHDRIPDPTYHRCGHHTAPTEREETSVMNIDRKHEKVKWKKIALA